MINILSSSADEQVGGRHQCCRMNELIEAHDQIEYARVLLMLYREPAGNKIRDEMKCSIDSGKDKSGSPRKQEQRCY